MAAPREDPLAYNGWAKMASSLAFGDELGVSDGESVLSRRHVLGEGPNGPPEYEFENPAEAWITLVEACRIEFEEERRLMVLKLMFLAKNSHWTDELYQTELELLDDEYGGPTEPISPEECAVSQADLRQDMEEQEERVKLLKEEQ